MLAKEIKAMEIYPLGGVRVRAMVANHSAIADSNPQNAYFDMVLRIGHGRTESEKKVTGEKLMKVAESFFETELASGYIMLSLEITEFNPEFSWKTNTVHKRLAKEKSDVA